MTDRELMQQALEALDWAADCIEPRKPNNCDCPICVASDALRERLAQPEQKRPQNCGTSYCSCIECVMEPETRPATREEKIVRPGVYEVLVEQEPVAAQHRFRHPQKGTPDWSSWQPCSVKNRPAWEIDSQGYEVEFRALYTTPPRREWQGLTEEDIDGVKHTFDWASPWTLAYYARAIEAKLKERNNG